MNLYERNYLSLTESEKKAWDEILEKNTAKTEGAMVVRTGNFGEWPKAARHFDSLFPNQFLDPWDLDDTLTLQKQLGDFSDIVKSNEAGERQALNFIKQNRAYFLIGSLLHVHFNFGHHCTHLFCEFPLGTTHVADCMLLGKNSEGWHFLFVELESPRGSITLKNGEPGIAMRKGLHQISEWRGWVEAHFSTLSETLMKARNPNKSFPDDFHFLDTTRVHYVVVSGLRSDFNDNTYSLRRSERNKGGPLILHYDNILDASRSLLQRGNY